MAGIYRECHPEHTEFYRVFFYYFEEFLREYEDRFEKEYGFLLLWRFWQKCDDFCVVDFVGFGVIPSF
jgi:hypothetical protein